MLQLDPLQACSQRHWDTDSETNVSQTLRPTPRYTHLQEPRMRLGVHCRTLIPDIDNYHLEGYSRCTYRSPTPLLHTCSLIHHFARNFILSIAAAAIRAVVSPYFSRSSSASPDSAKQSLTPTRRTGTARWLPRTSATAPPNPPRTV